jgi:uncharacterized Zn finger protein (UPF0148 family)
MTGIVMLQMDCFYCGKPLRGFTLCGDIECIVCDTCISPFAELFSAEFRRSYGQRS